MSKNHRLIHPDAMSPPDELDGQLQRLIREAREAGVHDDQIVALLTKHRDDLEGRIR